MWAGSGLGLFKIEVHLPNPVVCKIQTQVSSDYTTTAGPQPSESDQVLQSSAAGSSTAAAVRMKKPELAQKEEFKKTESDLKRNVKLKTKKKKSKEKITTTTSLEQHHEEEQQSVVFPGGSVEGSYEPKKMVVSGMPYSTTEDDIREFFKEAGHVSRIQMTTFPDSGNFKGLAFLTFKSAENATKSLDLDGRNMGDRSIKVERCRVDPEKARKRKRVFPEEPQRAEGCLSAYIGNLAKNVSEDDIKKFLEKSKIESIRLALNKKTGKFRGFGHIDFVDDASLEEALKKNQVEFHGRQVKVTHAVSNKSLTEF